MTADFCRRNVLILLSIPLFMTIHDANSFLLSPRGNWNVPTDSRLCASSSVDPSSSSSSSLGDDNLQQLKRIQERRIQVAIVEELFSTQKFMSSPSSSSSLATISLLGKAKLALASRIATNETNPSASQPSFATLLVLAPGEEDEIPTTVSKSLLVPLVSPQSQLNLLSFAFARRPISSLTVLLALNALFVNRDGCLFDNLPWAEWSRDPQRRNRDAAGNPIDAKFHLGKRDAYNRFMGKDWPGRSLALRNLALRMKYMVTAVKDASYDGEMAEQESNKDVMDMEETQRSLAVRMLQLRIRELKMDMADTDSQLAVARNNYNGDDFVTSETRLAALETAKADLRDSLQKAEEDLELLSNKVQAGASSETSNAVTSVFDRIAGWSSPKKDNAAPYRGAIGYDPMLDTRQEMDETAVAAQQYSSPYDLLKEVLSDQLNAKVIGCVLENTSLLRGNVVLGGAIVLQRLTPTKTARVAGEEVQYNDYDETFGNEGIKGGEIMVVECDVDEAIGVSLACNLPLKVESTLIETSSVIVNKVGPAFDTNAPRNMKEVLPVWKVVDSAMSMQVEGDVATVERPSPISIPRTTISLFDSIFEPTPSYSDSLFPTDNPIKSLDQLDGLSNADKAKTLLEMSNFKGKLPRPRVVMNAAPNENPLDKLLLPLIDETVRKQYTIREAEIRGDWDLVRELKASKSNLQKAKERAEDARKEGNTDLANQLDEEVRLLESLRADVTQDVGAYSRFLDRDEWYERNRQRTAKRTKKSSFGKLLDGIA